jgi:SNF2 family DNA or RNA helicase
MAIYTSLMQHQKTVLDFVIKDSKQYFGIFAEYGTGKTLMALAYINIRRFNKILVISTKTAITSTWIDEIYKHTNFQYALLTGSRPQRLTNLKMGLRKSVIPATNYSRSVNVPVIFLINFDGIHSIFDELCQARFDMILIDESTKIKDPYTERSKAIVMLGRFTKVRCVMTGFPITENLADIYAQIKFLDQGKLLGVKFDAFLAKYFVKMGMKALPKKTGAVELIKSIKPFCIRVTAKDLNLPPSVYKTIHIPQNEIQKKLFKSLYDLMRVELGKVKIDTIYIFTLIAKSLQICDGFLKESDEYNEEGELIKRGTAIERFKTPKDEALFDLVDEINLDKHKLLIWCNFRNSVSKLARVFDKMGYNPLTLTGDTKDVGSVIHKFQHDKKFRVCIATQKKASESITMTVCNHAVYYSQAWSNDLRMNSEARIRRKGSEHHDSIYYTDLAIRNSIEDQVIQCLKDKKNLVTSLKNVFLKDIK